MSMARFGCAALVLGWAVLNSAAQTKDALTPVKVAVIAPQTGSSAYFGKVVTNGIALSLKSAKGIEYRVFDDKSDASSAAGIVAAATEWGAAGILGPLDSDVAATAAEAASRLRVAMISPCATATHLSEAGNEWFFRANTSDRERANELAAWATELVARKGVLIVHETRSKSDLEKGRPPIYGEALAADLLAALEVERQPAAAVGFQREAFGEAAKQAIVARVRENALGAVALLARSLELVPIAEFIRGNFPDLPILLISPGRDQFSGSTIRDGVYAVTDTVIEVTNSSVLDDFRRRYSLAFPGEPSPTQQCATFGYDAGQILVSAITRASAEKSSDIAEWRVAVRDEIAATPNDRQGLVSVGGFTPKRELNFRPHRAVLRRGTWTDNGENGGDGPDITRGGIMYFVVLLLFLAALIALLVWQLPKLHRFNDRTVVFVISAVVGLVSALVTFGALRSYGSVSGQSLGVAFEFGGPAALFIIVLMLGTRPSRSEQSPFTVTIILRDVARPGTVASVDGTISLLLAREARHESIKNGQAVVADLRAEYRNHSVDFVLKAPGFVAVADGQLRLTPDAVLYVKVRKEPKPAQVGD
jgi:ABC-type branched-subunit amino acid transport system substrate-binding protein